MRLNSQTRGLKVPELRWVPPARTAERSVVTEWDSTLWPSGPLPASSWMVPKCWEDMAVHHTGLVKPPG